MLRQFDFNQIDKRFVNFKRSDLGNQLDRLQRIAQRLNIPILILVDGWESSGKGQIINDLTRELDPRYVRVEVFEASNDIERAHPSVWRFWQKIPSRREMVVYDRSFYYQVFNHDERTDEKLEQRIDELLSLEKMLLDDQTIIVKLFLNVTQTTQAKRIKKLEEDIRKDILLSKEDYEQNEDYEEHQKWFDKILEATDTKYSPWHIISTEDLKVGAKTALGTTLDTVTAGIEQITLRRTNQEKEHEHTFETEAPVLNQLDLSHCLTKTAYDEIKEELQEEAAELVYQCYLKKIAIVLAFEGVDAAGKGGAIKRLTRHIDPRSYSIYGINAPNSVEEIFHYLWRFQTELPADGDMVIFDRSWYGRVLVERVEKLIPQLDWERAYSEINQMEKNLTDHGTVVMKFFLYIDKDEQEARFKARINEPEKNYKITEEDFRNRDKWDDYIDAMNEMLERTHQANAPWFVIPGNDKHYARIQVLKEFIKHLKQHLINYSEYE